MLRLFVRLEALVSRRSQGVGASVRDRMWELGLNYSVDGS